MVTPLSSILDVDFQIFSYLDASSLGAMERTCKLYQGTISNSSAWKQLGTRYGLPKACLDSPSIKSQLHQVDAFAQEKFKIQEPETIVSEMKKADLLDAPTMLSCYQGMIVDVDRLTEILRSAVSKSPTYFCHLLIKFVETGVPLLKLKRVLKEMTRNWPLKFTLDYDLGREIHRISSSQVLLDFAKLIYSSFGGGTPVVYAFFSCLTKEKERADLAKELMKLHVHFHTELPGDGLETRALQVLLNHSLQTHHYSNVNLEVIEDLINGGHDLLYQGVEILLETDYADIKNFFDCLVKRLIDDPETLLNCTKLFANHGYQLQESNLVKKNLNDTQTG